MALFLPIWVLFSWISIVVVGGLVAFSRDGVARQIVGKRLLVGVGNWYVLFAEHYAVALDDVDFRHLHDKRPVHADEAVGRKMLLDGLHVHQRQDAGGGSPRCRFSHSL